MSEYTKWTVMPEEATEEWGSYRIQEVHDRLVEIARNEGHEAANKEDTAVLYLLTAVPDLLAALEDIARSDTGNWSGYTARGVAHDLAGRARDAIEKGEGK